MHQLKERAREALSPLPALPKELADAVDQIQSPSALPISSSNSPDLTPAEKQDLLETFDVQERLDKLLRILAQQMKFCAYPSRSAGGPGGGCKAGSESTSFASSSPNPEGAWRGEGAGARSPSCVRPLKRPRCPRRPKAGDEGAGAAERTPEASAEHP